MRKTKENKLERGYTKLTNLKSYKIQVIRGIAIVGVVFIHNTGGVYQAVCRPFLNFAVATFLFLSGMLSDADKWNPKKRIKKILIPYILWTMAYVIIGNFHNLSEIPLIFLKRLLLGNSAAIMYYVFVECVKLFL